MTAARRRIYTWLCAVALVAPAAAAGSRERIDCKGVLSYADAMARAVRLSLDPQLQTIRLVTCGKYPELSGLCHGDLRVAAEHHFVFGGAKSVENTRLTARLYLADAGLDAGSGPSLMVYFVGHCAPREHRR